MVPLADPLSDRELEVLRLLPTYLTSSEIADQLYIAPSTVRSHIKHIYSKLQVHGRAEAVQRAEELALI
jgi:LuxR family maltose regulon positive regulatory protein